MNAQEIEITVVPELAQIGQEDWDACACPEAADGGRPRDPFTTYRFLSALERSGSVGPGTGWQPQYLVARIAGQVIAVAPMYAKSHSQGEYIFDHNWAHAYERAGGRYYPKLQIAVPHTPATGRRFLMRPGFEEAGTAALVQGAVQLTDNNALSSLHVTFCTEGEVARAEELGLMSRKSQQFHWHKRDYADFDGFLASLSSRKRKNIRKERAQAQDFGGKIHTFTGDQIEPEHWDAFWQFYQDTGARKWGSPYLTREFFDHAQENLRDDIALVLAERDGRWVAGALNFIGRETLFGRYWGCTEHHPFLHFELCYYRAMDFAIAHGLARVEAGAQGEHKLARGYLPSPTWSLHWMRDPGFAAAVGEYLQAERDAVDEEISVLTDYGPFKKTTIEEQE
ncbi:N-acetyltransferase [Sulfitobacter sp. KE34]|uniref:GNAT family N-acetyltransferase n=1 Tax=Sulfitobacter faviae TaxID=1775881 RepID=A0AAX3LPA8_9RHOB|nr:MULTISPECIES: GNAT family N-acetyltransferase [Sulfitobacter]MDF3350121.1 N-acetyltransferase [Sulfitobacter sp. KE12]MDF3353793.1 N-acetyltransferase [Sulfitobacter sp. KE27]MDF3357441.1 N-acetyltransferase [Sulfitobacter sp. KE33]MDF3361785.1 N-acetyltransferase [Sulfitobacter sp. Ks41]MDF3364865.1 N-acetyltransferase [Sulfitobacter sp. Ks34]